MNYQFLIDKKPSLDQRWHNSLNAILRDLPEVYSFLEPSAEELKKLRKVFVESDYRSSPDLRVHSDASRYVEVNQELVQLKQQVLDSETNDSIRNAYVKRIDELIIHHAIPIAVANRDDHAFHEHNMHLYGQPDAKIFAAICCWMRQLASSSPHLQQANEVLKKLPDLGGSIDIIVPIQDVFAAVRKLHFTPKGYVEHLFNLVTIPERVTEVSGRPVVEQILKNLGSDYLLRDAPVFWGVSHASKSVYCAAEYDLPRAEFSGIVAHEIGSHLLEYLNGSRQPLRLLATGLDHYEHCNEGRAYLREQIFYESIDQALLEPSWEHIITMHLAISLASGLHEHRYSFAEVYDVILAVGTLLELERGTSKSEESARERAHQQAWVTTVRTLKGTDGKGGAYLKDIVYMEANSKCWAAAKKDPSLIVLGDLGKFDLFREEHTKLLRDLSIIG